MRTNPNQLKKYLIKYIIVFLLFFVAGCAGTKGELNNNWIENRMASMSIEQKIGQMMAIAYTPKFYNQNNPEFKELENLVKNYHVGGFTFLKGNPYAAARCIDRFQDAAEIPLLVMSCTEWGLAMRVEEATSFMENMAVGATRSEEYAYEIGKISWESISPMRRCWM